MSRTTPSLRSNPIALLLIIGSIGVIYVASQFPSEGQIGPGFFPILIAVGIVLFAIVDLFVDDEPEAKIVNSDMKSAGAIFVLVLAYVGLMPLTGFLVGTMAFLLISLYYSGVRSKVTLITLSFGSPIALFYIFSEFFLIQLPIGIVPFSRLLPPLPLGVML